MWPVSTRLLVEMLQSYPEAHDTELPFPGKGYPHYLLLPSNYLSVGQSI